MYLVETGYDGVYRIHLA